MNLGIAQEKQGGESSSIENVRIASDFNLLSLVNQLQMGLSYWQAEGISEKWSSQVTKSHILWMKVNY